jgi:hypothetical protein
MTLTGPVEHASDQLLITRVCIGDMDAVGLLFRRYAGVVRGVAYRVLRASRRGCRDRGAIGRQSQTE